MVFYIFYVCIYRELLDKTIAPKQEKLTPVEQNQLIQLLMSKNEELKEVYQVRSKFFHWKLH